uniref:Uncharacterized protein n=1 Tax=Oryza meridionalis TaxID=40149 RepID=A0A0E0F7M8_9ORYZ
MAGRHECRGNEPLVLADIQEVATDDVVAAIAGEAAAGGVAAGEVVVVVMVAGGLGPPDLLGGALQLLEVLRLRRPSPLLGAPVHGRHPPHQLLLQQQEEEEEPVII